MDHLSIPLNPCSLESLSEPVKTKDNKRFWPVILSCYELQSDGTRVGQMVLFCVQVPDLPTKRLEFGPPHTIVEEGNSGILDGKWFPKQTRERKEWWFATARSTGELCIQTFQLNEDPNSTCSYRTSPLETRASIRSVEGSEYNSKSCSGETTPALCLALNWDTSSESDTTTSIVSSYSNGMVAVHDVGRSDKNGSPILVERNAWLAHTFFGDTPAEVWSCCFAAQGRIVISGGDDGKAKFWDILATTKPIQILQDFDAGVTVISPHPRKEHLVAMGSYDETIAIYDVRYTSQAMLKRSEPLGGGIWRIQWHPIDDDKILVAAMHGGCRVVHLSWSDNNLSFIVMKEFTEHDSMAYGADWLVHDQPDDDYFLEVAASCSFYDRAAFLWDAK